ncbi:bifunctional aldolase/short-chain dehydrogenase [Desulfurivibrio dismutans]|uniref:bifunctional aldolase/short-chain dehydrogenase n=1 Tax=Desulfurivibrio dismutans TaxID=1398908 RepID=UPI0023DC7E61|nr:bifunctional aldolase/short-chain dehydrogenase [Desulfurivibrio alkaliphilus]MDF1615392.1 bifunctional aldolase/short-chain dehydrogenase [Desulfurivibrio alkaliphilus]
MKNRYNHEEAQAFAASRPECSEFLALRVYTSRLIGAEAELVLHGGGNTSVKDVAHNILGEEMEVLYIKGSGWDLATIEAAGFPALDLAWLRRLRALDRLSDEEMVNQFRTHLLDASAPGPSIETLVHAFLPHRFIDHTHADAIVTLTNRQRPEEHLRRALGEKIAILPFIMPGFPLAKAMAVAYEQNPGIEAIILLNHGIFTFADEAEIAYRRMIDYVNRAEDYLTLAAGKPVTVSAAAIEVSESPAEILPLLRGALSRGTEDCRSFSLEWRRDPDLLTALARPDARHLFTGGVLTPDHVIRTKNYPLWLDFAGAVDEAPRAAVLGRALAEYAAAYERYFAEQCAALQVEKKRLDPMPRVIMIPGLGLLGAGDGPAAARIAADIASHTVRAKLRGEALGEYRELEAASIFAMEYWSLEQVKLGKGSPRLLEGRVALVTGGGGAMALGIADRLLAAGARVFLADIQPERLQMVVDKLRERFAPELVQGVEFDVTDPESVRSGLERLVAQTGGLDILVPNAGIAQVARLEDLRLADFRRVMAVNADGVLLTIREAAKIFRRQGCGGQIVINSSKNVFDPGASFGAYSASKAAAHQLGKIAALELAEIGVRVNMINADAVFDAEGVSSGLWDLVGPERMRARNLDPEGLRAYYRDRNLLKTEVKAEDVGNAVVFFAANLTPTTGATLPVDGGIPAAFPR